MILRRRRRGLKRITLALILRAKREPDLRDSAVFIEPDVQISDEFAVEIDPDLARLAGNDVAPPGEA